MYVEFVQDDSLIDDAIIIEDVARPCETLCNDLMDKQRQGPDGSIELALRRCIGGKESWWGCVAEILLKRQSRELLVNRLGLTPPCSPPVDPGAAFLKAEIKTITCVTLFSQALASRVAWSQLMFRFQLPFALAFMLSTSKVTRKEHMASLKLLILALVGCQDAYISGASRVKEVLEDAGCDDGLSIEIMALLLQENFDENSLELRRLMRRFYSGGLSTFDLLEKCFAHLSDVVNRSVKNKK
jgi:hypothetical protein